MGKEAAEALKVEVERMAAAGCTSNEIARSLGIHVHTVYRWRRALPAGLGGFRRVEVGSPAGLAEGRGVVLVTPSGYRLEGLTLEQAALILRAVG